MDIKEASILLVEDEPMLREIMCEWLKRVVGQVFCAEDGAAALKILAASKIDLIISDVRMPAMDGIALLKKIKESGGTPGMIFITGFSDVPLREAHDMGAEAILEKPIHREELLRAAQRSLADADELWREPPAAAPEMKLKMSFPSFATALEEKRIAFGRRGFCIESASALREGPVEFTMDFKTDQQVMTGHGMVRWTSPQEHQAGIEITYVDDASRAWLIDLMERNKPVPFIPRSTKREQSPKIKTA